MKPATHISDRPRLISYHISICILMLAMSSCDQARPILANTPPANGEPLVVITNGGKPDYSSYYPEILRNEGISSFSVIGLGDLAEIERYQVAILAEGELTDAEARKLENWVSRGGRLIAMRPDPRIEGLLGIGPRAGTVADGYFSLKEGRWGVPNTPLQFHGTADLHRSLADDRRVGAILRGHRIDTGFPAITIRQNIGAGRGQAIGVMFDIARSVALTRQGNPALAADPTGGPAPRAARFFAGYLDSANYAIPQADEQQRILVALIHESIVNKVPLPRLWYLPGGRRLAVVMTGDDHNANGTLSFFEQLRREPFSDPGCSVDHWDCARATSWVFSNVKTLKRGNAAALVADGFEIGPHMAMDRDGGCGSWSNVDDLFNRFAARQIEFQNIYGIEPTPTNRTHCYVFADWDTEPRVERQLGIRLDETYSPYTIRGTRNRLGRLNGSAMPMRFTDRNGSAIDVYQLVSDIDYEYFDSSASVSDIRAAIRAMIDGALKPDGYRGFIGTHYDFSGGLEAEVRNTLLSEIVAHGGRDKIAIISARQLLDWLDLRNGSSFSDLAFDGSTLSFSFEMNHNVSNPGLEAMIPLKANGRTLHGIFHAGSNVRIKRRDTVDGVPYAFIDAIDGDYRAIYR